MSVLFQLWGSDNPLNTLISFAFFIIFFMFYPRLMLGQIMWKLDKTVKDLEEMSAEAKHFIAHEISKKPDEKLHESLGRFFEFFLIAPVSLDPFGIVRKIDHLVENQEEKFRYFLRQVAPELSEEKLANIEMGLAGGMTLYELTKIVRHYVEVVKQTKSFQLAMMLQMQLPLLEKVAKSVYKGTKTLARGEPIGDAFGPYAVARLSGQERVKVMASEEMTLVRKDIRGRDVFLLKARGPGGRVGKPGKAVELLAKEHKFAKFISIDAAAKLEGEKTGSVAEGVGVAMGGVGTERSRIEEVAVKNNIPLDSVIVKMSSEEAIEPLRKAILDAYPKVIEAVDRSLDSVKKGSKVLIIGVGNTSGVGNSSTTVAQAEELAEKYEKKLQEKKKKKKK